MFKCKRCGLKVYIKIGNCPECSSSDGWEKVKEPELVDKPITKI